MKGADVVMAGIVQYNDWLEEEVDVCPSSHIALQSMGFDCCYEQLADLSSMSPTDSRCLFVFFS